MSCFDLVYIVVWYWSWWGERFSRWIHFGGLFKTVGQWRTQLHKEFFRFSIRLVKNVER